MDRQALAGEDARAAQRRLYLEAMGLRECAECGRVGKLGFVDVEPTLEEERRGRAQRRSRCRSPQACARRRGIVGRTYYDHGEPVEVLAQWHGGGPRNVLVRELGGRRYVRPFRGLRRSRPQPLSSALDGR